MNICGTGPQTQSTALRGTTCPFRACTSPLEIHLTASDGNQPTTQANPEHVALLSAGVEAWNRWRTTIAAETPIELAGAQLQNMDLRGADLRHAHLTYAHLAGSDLIGQSAGAKLDGANLDGVNLMEADLFEASAHEVHMRGTIFDRTNLMGQIFLVLGCTMFESVRL